MNERWSWTKPAWANETLASAASSASDRACARGLLTVTGLEGGHPPPEEQQSIARGVSESVDAAAFALVECLASEAFALGRPDEPLVERVEAALLELLKAACVREALQGVARARVDEAIDRFESGIEPLAHRLVAVNELREFVAGLLPPALGRRAVVRRGLGVAPAAVADLGEVAALVATYPAAAAEFATLVAYETRLRHGVAASPVSHAAVRSLRAFVAARRAESTFRVAAADRVARTTLITEPAFVVAYEEPGRLLVDVLEDDVSRAPYLALAGATEIPSRPVEGTVGRFDFRLGAEVLDAIDAVLVLPFASGERRMPLSTR